MASMALPNPLPPDEDRSPGYLAVMVICLVLTITFVALRVWVRISMVKSFGLDDWFMLAALVSLPIEHWYLKAEALIQFHSPSS